LTSTIRAIFGDYTDVMEIENRILSDKYFNTSSSVSNNAYHYSKVLAEKEGWQICEAQKRWTMVAINPGLVPTLAISDFGFGKSFVLNKIPRGYFWFRMRI
jgi:hypothetical protein